MTAIQQITEWPLSEQQTRAFLVRAAKVLFAFAGEDISVEAAENPDDVVCDILEAAYPKADLQDALAMLETCNNRRPIIAAGFVITDSTAIWGTGATEEEAWGNWRAEMTAGQIRILADDEPDPENGGDTTRQSAFACEPATAALIEEVGHRGGAIAWGYVGGVACTTEEEAEAAA